MGIQVALFHETVYTYDRPLSLGPHLIRLRPAPHSRTKVLSYSLRVEPETHFLNWQQDPQSNFLARVVFPEKVHQLRVTVDLVADMTVINPFDFFVDNAALEYPFKYDPWLSHELAPFLLTQPAGPKLKAWLASIDTGPRPTIDFLVELNARVQQEIDYLIRLEPGVQTPEQTLEKGSGSCRDTSWLLTQILRNLGVAARFVSGYLIQLKPDVKSLDGPSGAEKDFTDLHAWCEAYIPGAGWIGLDSTSGLLAGEGHIPLAATPDPGSAAPITGTLEPGEADFEHTMRITRVKESPRVTKPYTEDQWRSIDQLGRSIDQQLQQQDVRLTTGGEPTFVSIDDMDGPEWNTDALGPNKRRLSESLIRRLHEIYATGGLLHFGQGKWYPGEQLPRWSLSCYWRYDRKPIWKDQARLADGYTPGNASVDDAEHFMELLCERLKLDAGYAAPAFEDPIYFMHREGKLPVNVDPADSKLKDPEERLRLRRVFVERGLSEPVGYVLPLRPKRQGETLAWESSLWTLRSKHILLTPGDSPIGLRLPLDSLLWVPPSQYPHVITRDPMAEPPPLPTPLSIQLQQRHRGAEAVGRTDEHHPDQRVPPRQRQPRTGESAQAVVRTAMCIEVREGRLHVFMPPLPTIEDYLELIAAIEDTARALDTAVVIEGEAPPHDPRIGMLRITPDPGVIEVNVQPARTWDELSDVVATLYEEARQCRLGTEKFMLDGRHTGTGGGNHVVLGGPTPNDSPFLRRPDLLRSLVAYWLNHPSLSYLFSGMFVGPTSQAPRIDEARHDSVYELELAFEELDHQQQYASWTPPWLVDRIFHNILVDMTGNTHRSEFCIDKLYSPDTASGRLGLIEFRAFEMPPHARMSLTQHLLLRALIAWFWQTPYRRKPERWGTLLHDRFCLPHYVWDDFSQVIGELNEAGYPIDAQWFAPHFEFRFPSYGHVEHAGVSIELRQAIEPWHVLGEEAGAGGTVRYVDSSVERLQVTVNIAGADRYQVVCNGQRLPLKPTREMDRRVCGVRYRAWQPPHCLHPTIGVDTPLVFDVFDTWTGRSIGGCTYHVSHPAGRNYETFPVNAMEAEARRNARFFEFGHTPGPMSIAPSQPNPEMPHTLDLRRPR